MWLIFPLEPPNLVNFLLYFETLEVVKLWFVALERAVHIVFSPSRNAVFALEQKQMPAWSSMASNTYHKCCNYCTTNFNIHFNVRQHSLCCYLHACMHAGCINNLVYRLFLDKKACFFYIKDCNAAFSWHAPVVSKIVWCMIMFISATTYCIHPPYCQGVSMPTGQLQNSKIHNIRYLLRTCRNYKGFL